MQTLIDQIGISHIFSSTPKRIISLVPSQTELLFDLKLEQSVVGITKFCVHPFYAKSVSSIIGGTKKVNFDKIRLLEPDIIIANKEENTLEMVEELRQICAVWVTDVMSIEDNLHMIADFGRIFQKRTEAQNLIDKIDFRLREFGSFIESVPIRKVAYFIWREPYMVAGSGTFIDAMLRLNHFENIYSNVGRYPEIQLKKIRIEGDPDIVFLSSEPYPFNEEHAFEIGRFTHHAKTIFVDGEMFSWYGSRFLLALDYFRRLHIRLQNA